MKWVSSNEAYTRSTIMTRFDQLMVGTGVDYETIMDEIGIPRAALHNRNLFISHERLCRFLERVAQVSGEPNLSLKHVLLLAPDFPNFGSLVQIARFCTNLRDWIRQASQLAWLQTNGWMPYLEERPDGTASFRIVESPTRKMPRQLSEGVLSSMFLLVRQLLEDRHTTPLRVCFRHEAPPDLSLHHEIFGCELHFGCKQNGFLFDAVHLDGPIGGSLVKFKSIFDIYVRAQIRSLTTRDITVKAAVSSAISNMAGTELCTAERIAELLGMNEKKMQRLLRDEGTSFRTEALAARRQLASDMLAQTQVPVGEIANILGYGSSTAFALAFHKATGLVPSEFRALHRAKA